MRVAADRAGSYSATLRGCGSCRRHAQHLRVSVSVSETAQCGLRGWVGCGRAGSCSAGSSPPSSGSSSRPSLTLQSPSVTPWCGKLRPLVLWWSRCMGEFFLFCLLFRKRRGVGQSHSRHFTSLHFTRRRDRRTLETEGRQGWLDRLLAFVCLLLMWCGWCLLLLWRFLLLLLLFVLVWDKITCCVSGNRKVDQIKQVGRDR